MPVCKSILDHPQGTLEMLLIKAYASFHERYPEYWEENRESFKVCDTFFYENPQIGNSCSFISEVDGVPVGMCSWDPREKPTVIIGHNCILPEFRGKGWGSWQMAMALNHLKDQGFTHAKVSTGMLDFFIPAQKMYESVGFKEVRRDNPDGKVGLEHQVYYEMELGVDLKR